mmetsp:Transcript_21116/g.66749  ORF Transcript_21116/g.66749 Transcript_21116/m.66749 type:complete len:313 (-) Transcript_21116:3-941(-)
MGPGQRHAEDLPYGPHQHGPGYRDLRQAPIPVQRFGGLRGQVLGPGAEHGHPELPRAPQWRLFHRPASHPEHFGDGRERCRRANLGHAHEGGDLRLFGAHQRRLLAGLAGRRATVHQRLHGPHGQALGPRCRQVRRHPHEPQEERAGSGAPPDGVHLRLLLLRQQQGLEVPSRPVRAEHHRPRGHRQRLRHPRGGAGLVDPHGGHRQRLPPLLGLAQRLQVPEPPGHSPARQHERRERDLRHAARQEREPSRHRRVRQDGEDLPRGPQRHPRHAPPQLESPKGERRAALLSAPMRPPRCPPRVVCCACKAVQ